MARMRYDNVELRVRPGSRKSYIVEIVSGPYRKASAPFKPPFSAEEVEQLFEVLDRRGLLYGHESPQIQDLAVSGYRSWWLDPEAIGKAMFQALFRDDVGRAFRENLAFVEGKGRTRGLRLRVGFDPWDPKLAVMSALPWELIYSAIDRDFLCRNRATPLARYVEVPHPCRRLKVKGMLRMLVVVSASEGLVPLNLAKECRRLLQALGRRLHIQISFLTRPSLKVLRRKLLEGPWHIVHLMGHGGFDQRTGEGLLYFNDPEKISRGVRGLMFVEHLKGVEGLRLVFLNSCSSGRLPRTPGQSPFATIAPALLMERIPAVIAMQFPILDSTAIAFSSAFYEQIAAGNAVDVAVAEGRLRAWETKPDSLEWATPLLFLGSQDSQILELPKENDQMPSRRPGAAKREPLLRLGIRSRIGWPVRASKVLALEKHFDGVSIKAPELWQTKVFPELEKFLGRFADEQRPLLLDFATHSSIAFAAGYILGGKSGLDIRIRQRTLNGNFEWMASGEASLGVGFGSKRTKSRGGALVTWPWRSASAIQSWRT